MFERILCIQLRRIGDVLMTTPAVRELRRAYPQAEITFLTEPPSDQVFLHNPHLDAVELWPRKGGALEKLSWLLELRSRRFDLVVDFFSNPQSAIITRFTGAGRRIGFDFQGRRWAYTDRHGLKGLPPYTPSHKLALLSGLGISGSVDLIPEVNPGAEDRAYAERQLEELGVKPDDFLVGISPVSRQPYKVWPAEQFARLADVLIERYSAKILLLWGPGEESFVDRVRLAMHHQALPDYPIPSLLQMTALLEKVHLLVGNDNGPRHFAIARRTPTVGVFGKTEVESWTPPGQPLARSVFHDPGCRQSCSWPKCGLECLNDLSFESVERVVEQLIEVVLKDGKPV